MGDPDQQLGDGPAIVAARLYERTDRHGRTYLVGRLGTASNSPLHGEADRGQPEAAADAAAAVQKRDDEHEAEGYEAYEVNPFARAPGSGIACVIWRLVSARGI